MCGLKVIFRPDLLDEEVLNSNQGKLTFIANLVECSEYDIFVAAAKFFDRFQSHQQMEKIFSEYLKLTDCRPSFVNHFCRLILNCENLDEAEEYLSLIRQEMGAVKQPVPRLT